MNSREEKVTWTFTWTFTFPDGNRVEMWIRWDHAGCPQWSAANTRSFNGWEHLGLWHKLRDAVLVEWGRANGYKVRGNSVEERVFQRVRGADEWSRPTKIVCDDPEDKSKEVSREILRKWAEAEL